MRNNNPEVALVDFNRLEKMEAINAVHGKNSSFKRRVSY